MSDGHQIAQDAALASVGLKTTIYGYGASLFAFLSDGGVAVAIGTIVTLIGFAMNWYYQRRRNKTETLIKEDAMKRQQEEHEWKRMEHMARMAVINERIGGCDDEPSVKQCNESSE